MSKKYGDGSTINSFFEIGNQTTGKDITNKGIRIIEGQVQKIHFTDDTTNKSKRFVEYDVVIKEPYGGISTFNNLFYIGDFSGGNNFSEKVLEANDYAYIGKLETGNLPKNKRGTMVYVAFLDGNLSKPFILGGYLHFKQKGAARSDGIRQKWEFNGIQWEINKVGELMITYLSEKDPSGKRTRTNTGPTQIKLDQQGRFSITDNEDQLIQLDRVTKKIKVVTKENFEITVGKDQIVTITGNNNETIQGNRVTNIQGNEDKTVTGNETVNIQGNETVTTTGDRVHSAANHTLTGGGDIKIGSAGSSENLVLGIQFMNLYNQHSHIGNLGIATGVPIQPMTASQLSQKNFTE